MQPPFHLENWIALKIYNEISFVFFLVRHSFKKHKYLPALSWFMYVNVLHEFSSRQIQQSGEMPRQPHREML